MSDGRKYYCFCDANCKFETMTKEQILAAIAQAAETGLVFDAESAFITKVKERNAGGFITFWVGTQAQFNALVAQGKKEANCYYHITDSTKDADMAKAIAEHVADKSNPHGVTASQVGARPNTWSPTPAEIGAVAKSELKKFAYSQTDENGNVTLDGITSYPTTAGVFRVVNIVAGLPSECLGYGSLVIFNGGSYVLHLYQDANGVLHWARTDNGVTAPSPDSWRKICDNINKPTAQMQFTGVADEASINTCLTTAMSKAANDSSKTCNVEIKMSDLLPGFDFQMDAVGTVCYEMDGYGYATLKFFSRNEGCVYYATTTCYNGKWYPLSWENPPMEFDTEYQTTEMWGGNSVYSKIISLGTVPVGEKTVDIGVGGVGSANGGLIRHYAFTNTGRSAISVGADVGEWNVSVIISDQKAYIKGGSGIGANNEHLYLQVWYTKM